MAHMDGHSGELGSGGAPAPGWMAAVLLPPRLSQSLGRQFQKGTNVKARRIRWVRAAG